MANQLFHDRLDAGRRLGESLASHAGSDVLVLGIPRGGIPVAAEVARRLGAELDVVVVRKLGHPDQPELAIGAVSATGTRVLNEDVIEATRVPATYVEEETARQLHAARERAVRLRGTRPSARVRDRVVILVDDGLATGATMRAAARTVAAEKPLKLIVAVPVGAEESCRAVASDADEVACLTMPDPFVAIGDHYERFDQVSDEEAQRTLEEAMVAEAR